MGFKSIGIFLVLFLALEHRVNCFDFSEAKLDKISGELEKPFNWTAEQFNAYKRLRLTVKIDKLFRNILDGTAFWTEASPPLRWEEKKSKRNSQ